MAVLSIGPPGEPDSLAWKASRAACWVVVSVRPLVFRAPPGGGPPGPPWAGAAFSAVASAVRCDAVRMS